MLKVKVENPEALHFILQDDIYLLKQDKIHYANALPYAPEIKTEEVKFNYMGGNKKKFLITTHYTGDEFIAEAHLTALQNVLKRKQLDMDDVAILNLAKHSGMDYDQVQAYFEPQTLLVLGQNAVPAGLTAHLLNTLVAAGGINLLYTFSFDEMMGSNDDKKVFWELVKTL